MITIKYYFTISIALLFSIQAFSQKSANEIKGDKYYSFYAFDNAIEKYNSTQGLTLEGQRRLAESYRNIGKYAESELAYSRFVLVQGTIAEDYYNYSCVLKMNGKYDDAIKWMNKFKDLKPNDLRVQDFSSDKTVISKLLTDEKRYKIVNLNLNSDEDDFGTAYYNNKIIFASSREGVKLVSRKYNWNRKAFLDIYSADTAKGQLNNIGYFNKRLNKKFHEGPASYSQTAKCLAYTQNNYKGKSKEGDRKLQIFFRNFMNDKWQTEVPFYLNSNEYSVGHPWLSKDGLTMCFSSDMPGGYGGADLYKTTKDKLGNWGPAINLGSNINTEGNELFPFFEESNKVLFFASNGHQGLGGLDVFMSVANEDNFGRVANLGTPINTQFDDFALIINPEMKNGYFSSNRVEGKGGDDIYSFECLKSFVSQKIVKGIVKNSKGEVVPNTLVKLVDKNNIEKGQLTTNTDGKYSFDVDNNEQYKLKGTKAGFDGSENPINTEGEKDVIYSDLLLNKLSDLSLCYTIVDKTSAQPLEGVKVKIINNLTLKSDTLISTSSGEVKKALLENKIKDNISYNISVSRDGYLSKTITYNQLLEKNGVYKLTIPLDKIDVGLDLAKLIDIKPIYFDLGKSNIRKDAALELNKIVKVMNENPNMVVELGSHTDCRGSVASNENLSNKRALSSADYIKKGITNPERIQGKGYGESRLKNACACEGEIKSTCSEIEHQQNRRTEFVIIKIE
jgi:outer membrane protein OmpA-like peptidoglycan-associated protein